MDGNANKEQGSDNMKEWLNKCKPLLWDKMEANIDTRQKESEKTINHAISTVLPEIKYNEDTNGQIEPISIEAISIETTGIKKRFLSELNQWKGLEGTCQDFAKYKKNCDNWWNRYKAVWFGDYFFYELLKTILPQYLERIMKNDPDNILSERKYTFLYFYVLNALICSEISFRRTQCLPLIPKQAFMPLKCKNTLQQLFTALGEKHGVPYDNAKIRRGEEAYDVAKRWVKDVLQQVQMEYTEMVNHQNDNLLGQLHAIRNKINHHQNHVTGAISTGCVCNDNAIDGFVTAANYGHHGRIPPYTQQLLPQQQLQPAHHQVQHYIDGQYDNNHANGTPSMQFNEFMPYARIYDPHQYNFINNHNSTNNHSMISQQSPYMVPTPTPITQQPQSNNIICDDPRINPHFYSQQGLVATPSLISPPSSYTSTRTECRTFNPDSRYHPYSHQPEVKQEIKQEPSLPNLPQSDDSKGLEILNQIENQSTSIPYEVSGGSNISETFTLNGFDGIYLQSTCPSLPYNPFSDRNYIHNEMDNQPVYREFHPLLDTNVME